jgi:rhodanese-related sulfurtransferase
MTRKHQKRRANKRNLIWLWIGLGVLAVVVFGILLLRPQATSSVEITPAQAYAQFQQGAFFLDVRTQDEWNQAHIAGSKLIPLDELQNRLDELPRDRDMVVVCRSGVRSKEGVSILQKAGFTRVACMNGGILAWKAAGYPLESGSQ